MARTKIKGLAQLEVKLKRKIPEAAKAAAVDAVTKGAGEMAGLMKSLAPEDDGDLEDSIVVTGPGETTPPYSQPGGSRTAGEMQALVTAGNSKVRYAHLVEFDTAPHVLGGKFKGAQHPGTDAQPFFFPAYRALRKRAKGRITRAINKAIREAFGKGGKKV
jgi:HK97 gp10 family phage protein